MVSPTSLDLVGVIKEAQQFFKIAGRRGAACREFLSLAQGTETVVFCIFYWDCDGRKNFQPSPKSNAFFQDFHH